MSKNFCTICFSRICNRKNVLLAVLLLFLNAIYCTPLRDFCSMSACRVTPWIFSFLLTDTNYLLLFMACIIYYFSDVPYMNQWNSYYLLRKGKSGWGREQICYILTSAFIITMISIPLSIASIIPNLYIEKGWGKVLYTLAKTNAGEKCDLFWKISSQYISKHTPFEAMMVSILFTLLGVTFIGCFMFCCALLFPKGMSILAATGLSVYSSVVVGLGDYAQRELSLTSPVSWKIGRASCRERV